MLRPVLPPLPASAPDNAQPVLTRSRRLSPSPLQPLSSPSREEGTSLGLSRTAGTLEISATSLPAQQGNGSSSLQKHLPGSPCTIHRNAVSTPLQSRGEPRRWRSWAFGHAPGGCGPPDASSLLICNVLVRENDPPKERQEGRGGKLGARRPACPGSSYPAARAPQSAAAPRAPEPRRERRRPRSDQDAAGRSRVCYGYIEFHED
ncbi:PREDICTED: uncharacterized protein LOC108544064 isoform X2 [Rhinopithecus bieti]|uniref:uncharacterized protein LOC108544064 isoform X2 n=1 Tax=Rhinopithecus bieti TaxID=61621 RepID=UPI00083C6F36|nr:PREDICTED: uncharacterized protein LOC108544064 isoform X2 [Rhinopithecus bieti]